MSGAFKIIIPIAIIIAPIINEGPAINIARPAIKNAGPAIAMAKATGAINIICGKNGMTGAKKLKPVAINKAPAINSGPANAIKIPAKNKGIPAAAIAIANGNIIAASGAITGT